MSTKATISYNNGVHLYEECFEEDAVYIEMKPEWWQFDGECVSIRIELNDFIKMLSDFNKYHEKRMENKY